MDELRARVNMLESRLGGSLQPPASASPDLDPQVLPASGIAGAGPLPTSPADLSPESQEATSSQPPPSKKRRVRRSSHIRAEATARDSSVDSAIQTEAPMVASDRLKRSGDGPFLHLGPTSIWVHDSRKTIPSRIVQQSPTLARPEDSALEVDGWRSDLPPALAIDRAAHDDAVELFNAYYAPWCATVDMLSFLAGLATKEVDSRHGAYSPLLHCVVVWIGLRMRQSVTMDALDIDWSVLEDHCTVLIRRETARPSLNGLRALNLLSSAFNDEPEVGYVFFGLVGTMVQVLGLNLNPEACVKRGEMTAAERDARSAAMWSMYLQDVGGGADGQLRAIAAGRPSILPDITDMPLPEIDATVDAEPWSLPAHLHLFASPRTVALSGLPSLVSTCLHWSAELALILRSVLDTLLMRRLDAWRADVAVQDPAAHPLPHIIVMHLTYHLVTVYLHRPFYRTAAHSPSLSAALCNTAASRMLELIKLYDDVHGIQLAPMTLVQAIFGCATIFLLRAASEQSVDADTASSLEDLQHCHRLMGQLARTWKIAHSARDVLRLLQAEWLPQADGAAAAAPAERPADTPRDLQDWLGTFDFSDILFFGDGPGVNWGV